jgi:hypothetical protein
VGAGNGKRSGTSADRHIENRVNALQERPAEGGGTPENIIERFAFMFTAHLDRAGGQAFLASVLIFDEAGA